jgi:hypothetical protein
MVAEMRYYECGEDFCEECGCCMACFDCTSTYCACTGDGYEDEDAED